MGIAHIELAIERSHKQNRNIRLKEGINRNKISNLSQTMGVAHTEHAIERSHQT
jgi:hypothetical protein